MDSRNKVLLIAPKYYDYYKSIMKEIERVGLGCEYIPDLSSSLFYTILNKYFPHLSILYSILYYRAKILTKQDVYGTIFVIKGTGLNEPLLKWIKNKYNRTNYILYQWDSMKNNFYFNLTKYYDKVFTFDRKDAEQYGFTYLPLFNSVECKCKYKPQYDISYVGSYSRDKYETLMKYINIFDQYNIYIYFYVSAINYIRMIFSGKINIKYLSVKKKSRNELCHIYENSKVILDIYNEGQSGLTMRTYEALGNYKKLITTNSNIKKEVYYNEKNIIILGKGDNNIHKKLHEFITSGYRKYSIDYFSLKRWVNNIL